MPRADAFTDHMQCHGQHRGDADPAGQQDGRAGFRRIDKEVPARRLGLDDIAGFQMVVQMAGDMALVFALDRNPIEILARCRGYRIRANDRFCIVFCRQSQS